MDFIHNQNDIALHDQTGKTIAEVTFPAMADGTVNVNHTFVDDSLRGQGVAGQLMQAVADELRGTNRKAKLTCSYAVSWFAKHPEFADILADEAAE